ncbi:cupin domain-containing protein [Parasphingopyxis algicola]|uniref:cupin domain-containing protein n=1 Tax=Parasphingopyxis algicola TaxID=2026624 RepID=UPI0015A032D4|nr:cupin domain-containing protein [Parasphingopyxis algicola]QLC26379.1 cupin domain-containing protein [Parasphingopyxis algicola]
MDRIESCIVGPDEGRSLWQPLPSRGYVTVNLTPENMPYDTFSSGIQVLPPGCEVREHGHIQNHELVFVYEGEGIVEINGEVTKITPGSTVLFSRNAVHRIENTGTDDMRMFWVFFPPGLENWFEAIGRERKPGDTMPEAFDRPDNVEEVMAQMRFLPPRAKD